MPIGSASRSAGCIPITPRMWSRNPFSSPGGVLTDLPRRRDDARAWLFGIARGVILNVHRGAERQRALAVRLADVGTGSMAGIDADLVARQIDVSRAWQRLSDVHQEALALAVLDGLGTPQAAAVLGISRRLSAAAQSRPSRAATASGSPGPVVVRAWGHPRKDALVMTRNSGIVRHAADPRSRWPERRRA